MKKEKKKKIRGITLIELLIASSLFTIVIGMAASAFIYIGSTQREINIEQEFYEEARFTMEKIVKEIRQGTVDYEEYYSNLRGVAPPIYGDDWGNYARAFYNCGDNTICGDDDDENTGEFTDATSDAALSAYEQNELYIINLGGNRKTILKLGSFTWSGFTGIGIYMLKMDGYDYGENQTLGGAGDPDTGEEDGVFDTWFCAKNFNCQGSIDGIAVPDPSNSMDGFIMITPQGISIEALKFYVAPKEDPRKAFEEATIDVQMQPRVSIVMTATLGGAKRVGYKRQFPIFSLGTTVSTRAFSEIKSIKR